MTRIQTHVQFYMRGKWKRTKHPCWVMQTDLCKNFPLCNRKLPSKKVRTIHFKQKGYCTKECYKRYKNKDQLRMQKLNNFLKEANPTD